MKLLKKPASVGRKELIDELNKALKKYNRVLWLIPGGSNIPIAVYVMSKLDKKLTSKLAIILTDERFGVIGHPDSNLVQLYAAGFKPEQAIVVPVLRENMDLEQTTRMYGEAVKQAFTAADYIVGQFGIGPDGHTAGILPNSYAIIKDPLWAVGYDTPEFTRITLTPYAISNINTAYIFAYGKSKRNTLTKLQKKLLDISIQPAQVFNHLKNVKIYNDQIGSSK